MNGTIIQYFEWHLPDDGKHWQRLAKDAQHLSEVGFSMVWMPPASKGTGTNDVGYGIYDLYDLGEFDQKGSVRTKYGSREDYQSAIKAIHDHKMWAIADVVLNHKAGADDTEKFEVYEVDPNSRQKKISDKKEIEAWTKFTFPGRSDQYSDFKWNWHHFSGVDFDQKTENKGIYMIKGLEKGWADNDEVDSEKGNYDYLMHTDVDYNNPEVVDETIRWAHWFVSEIAIDGFRLDAVKHIEDDFMQQLVDSIRKERPDFFAVGEYWKYDYNQLEDYIEDTEFSIDLFDVSLHQHFKQASESNNQYDMSKIMDNTLMQKNPSLAVTFVDNHDSQPGQSLESWVQDWFKPLAYTLILLQDKGLPCVFYGDYYGIQGDSPIAGKQAIIDKLMDLRKEYAYGQQYDYFDHANCVGFTRSGNDEYGYGLAVLMSNGDKGYKKMYVGEQFSGQIWVDYLGESQGEVVIDEDGHANFTCEAGSVSIWVNKESL